MCDVVCALEDEVESLIAEAGLFLCGINADFDHHSLNCVEVGLVNLGVTDGVSSCLFCCVENCLLVSGELVARFCAVSFKVGKVVSLIISEISCAVELREVVFIFLGVVTVFNSLYVARCKLESKCNSNVVVLKLVLLLIEEPRGLLAVCSGNIN